MPSHIRSFFPIFQLASKREPAEGASIAERSAATTGFDSAVSRVPTRKAVDMKLGMNTFFISMLDFEEGLRFCQEQEVVAVEVAATGPGAKKYCDVDKLLADQGELDRWLDMYAAHGLEIYSFAGHGTPWCPTAASRRSILASFARRASLWNGSAARGWRWWPVCPRAPRAIACRSGSSTPICLSCATPSSGSGSSGCCPSGENMPRSRLITG